MFVDDPNNRRIVETELSDTVGRLVLAVAGGVLLAMVLLHALCLLLWRDHVHHACAGQVALDGGFPSRDILMARGPAMSYTYALAMWLFGESIFGIRVFSYVAALVIDRSDITDVALAKVIDRRLLLSFRHESGLFPH